MMSAVAQQGRWIICLDGHNLPDRHVIGGKGWSIAHMLQLGLPVPPAFVISTAACTHFLETGNLPEGLLFEIQEGVAWLETQTGRSFGQGPQPLLVSVRSGAPVSMPGMMDTVLNLGITATTMEALAAEADDPIFARDTYRRFHELYAQIVLNSTPPPLDDEEPLAQWIERIEKDSGATLPSDPKSQLHSTVKAVFQSWTSRRAKRYRKHHGIPDTLGTAVIVQAMVFGNLGEDSGTGVLFSRNPLTGVDQAYGEYLPKAQGEDVVSGKFTPRPLVDMQYSQPAAFEELIRAAKVLERDNHDVQDIEFTVQRGKLFLLQSRAAKRSPLAAVRTAVDMHREGVITIDEAIRRVQPEQVRTILSPRLTESAVRTAHAVAEGLPVSHGVGVGTVVTSADDAEARAALGEAVVLATATTSPDDVHGMLVAKAVITELGGATSHAAVVGRALGLPCVVGCGEGSVTQLSGQVVTVDGEHGKVYAGSLEVVTPCETEDDRLSELLSWAQVRSPLTVYRPGEEPADTTDLEHVEAAADPTTLPKVLSGLTGARGGAIASDEGVAAALKAGLRYIVAQPTLPALLAAIHASDLGVGTNETQNNPVCET